MTTAIVPTGSNRDAIDTKVDIREDSLKPLRQRQDKEREYYELEPYQMVDKKGNVIPEVINVTDNKPQTDAKRIISAIRDATMQAIVEGKGLSDTKTSEIEKSYECIYNELDEILPYRDITSLRNWEAQQVAIRGGLSARCTLRTAGEELILDIVPCDFRYFTWQFDIKGLDWVAYTTDRNADLVKSEYADLIKDYNVPYVTGQKIKVRDYWDRVRNVVLLNGVKVIDQENLYKEVPFVFTPNENTTTFADSNSIKHYAPSIYESDSGLFDENNRALSISQTLLVDSFFGSLQKEVLTDGSEKQPKTAPFEMRKVFPYPKGSGKYERMPVNDVNQASRLAIQRISLAIQNGLLSSIDYGTTAFPLSAVAISKLTSARDLIFVPLLNTIALFRRQLSSMIANQIIMMNINATIGTGVSKIDIKPSTFDVEYETKYKFYAKTPEQDMANISVASAAGTLVSDKYKRRNILQLENPEEEERLVSIEVARMSDAVLDQYYRVLDFIDQGENIGAWLAFKKFKAMFRQEMGGQSPMVDSMNTRKQPQPSLPLFSGGKGAASAAQGEEEVA